MTVEAVVPVQSLNGRAFGVQEEVSALSRNQIEVLLSRLCIELGFCLPPTEQKRIAEQPPVDTRAFTDAVFVAEGLDPTTADRHLYRQVRDMVSAAFQDGAIAREGDA